MPKIKTNAIAAGEPLVEPSEPVSSASQPPVPIAPEVKAAVVEVAAAGAINRPGLETPATPPAPTNPFTLLNKWEQGEGQSRQVFSLRALEVPGGCLVKSAFAVPGYMGEALCFVPDVRIVFGKLVDSRESKGDGA